MADRPRAPAVVRRDWAALEAGLVQRARLLEAVLDDLYGPQRVLRRAWCPPRPCSLAPATGGRASASPTPVPGSPWRRPTSSGTPRAASSCCATTPMRPAGAGYALVTRKVLGRLFPDVYRDLRVERLSGWFDDLRAALARLAPPDRPSPRTVVLTPGIGHPSYFEHTYLASHLGYHLVEGADLAVRGGRVWLRALAGLEPVDVVLRRMEDGHADPLERASPGPGGVPGLVQASREGGSGWPTPSAAAWPATSRSRPTSPRRARRCSTKVSCCPRRPRCGSATRPSGPRRSRSSRRWCSTSSARAASRRCSSTEWRRPTVPTCSAPSSGTRAATWPRPASSWPPRR